MENQNYNSDTAKAGNQISYTLAVGAKLPKRAKAFDLRGKRIGKIRKSVLKNENDSVLGKFVREQDDLVYFYAPDQNGELLDRAGYVDKNNNLLTLENDYLATIKYHNFALILLPLLFLVVALTVLSCILGSFYLTDTRGSIPTLFVTEEGGPEWKEDELIRVFRNGVYQNNKIHPGMEGEYKFCFENRNENRLNYSMTFAEENSYTLNMGYRLRQNNVYVLGTENGYLGVEDLHLEDVTIESKSSAIYTLEWKWLDDDAVDTIAGMEDATYTLHITLNAHIQNRT